MRRTALALTLAAMVPAALGAVPTGKYLMSFHACDVKTANCNSPTNHKTYIAESSDGQTWTVLTGFSTIQGSVPDLVRRGNKLYVYIPGKMTRYNLDTNIWETTTNISISRTDGTLEPFVDPSPIFDENGSIVLFYLVSNNTIGTDPASCLATESSCTKIIRSATEVAGSDGTKFTVDSGNRAEITIISNSNQKVASDPDIFAGPSGYVLYVSRGMGVQALTSSTLKGSYANISGLSGGILVDGSGGVPAGHYDPNTMQFWTYVTKGQTDGTQVIRRAVTTSLSSAIADASFTTVVSGTSVGLGSTFLTASPGFVVIDTGVAAAAVSGSSSGNNASLTVSASVTIASGDVGKTGMFFVAALYKGLWFANNGTTWVPWSGGALPAFSTVPALGSSQTLSILNNADVTGLTGAQIFAGYGTSQDDMLNNAKYGLIYTVP